MLVTDDAVADALVELGCDVLTRRTTSIDAESLEVSGVELGLFVLTAGGVTERDARRMTPGEVAYAVGSRSPDLSEVDGGPLSTLARVARRVPGYEVAPGDPGAAARAVLGRW